jgi:hypothetical protein
MRLKTRSLNFNPISNWVINEVLGMRPPGLLDQIGLWTNLRVNFRSIDSQTPLTVISIRSTS